MNAKRRTGMVQTLRWGGAVIAGIAYSVSAHLAAASSTPGMLNVLVAVAPLIGLAFILSWRSSYRGFMLTGCAAVCVALYGISSWLLDHYNWVFLLQHAGMYALLCAAFGRTLLPGHTPMITGFARFAHKELSPKLLRYTRSATWAWSLYFACTSAISLLLFWLAPTAIWSTFANLLGGPLLILMFVAEYIVRCQVLPVEDRVGPLEALRAYRQASSKTPARQP